MTIKEAKAIDLVAYLSGLGIEPLKIRGHQYWYLSPLRAETIPSFKVNRRLNRWYDFGAPAGTHKGNLVDFGILFHRCSVAEFLAGLGGRLPQHQRQEAPAGDAKIKVTGDRPLTAKALLNYLQSRGITIAAAKAWCREVDYQIKTGIYYAVGFRNNSGGYELRNAQYKLSSSPKDITTLAAANAKTLHVFEGFTDFLSYLSLPGSRAAGPASYLVLNGAGFFEKAVPVMEQFPAVKLYFDHDPTGRKLTEQALALGSAYQDKSSLYQGHKDLNDYLLSLKKTLKQQLKPRL